MKSMTKIPTIRVSVDESYLVPRFQRILLTSGFLFQIFPRQKDAEFDLDGRPFNTFFYTKYPNYNKALYEIVERVEDIVFYQDRMMTLVRRSKEITIQFNEHKTITIP